MLLISSVWSPSADVTFVPFPLQAILFGFKTSNQIFSSTFGSRSSKVVFFTICNNKTAISSDHLHLNHLIYSHPKPKIQLCKSGARTSEFQRRFYHYLVEQVNSKLKGGELNMMENSRVDQLTIFQPLTYVGTSWPWPPPRLQPTIPTLPACPLTWCQVFDKPKQLISYIKGWEACSRKTKIIRFDQTGLTTTRPRSRAIWCKPGAPNLL